MSLSTEWLVFASALVTIFFGKKFYHILARPARDDLRYDPKYLKSVSRAREERCGSHTGVCGILVEPGEEIEFLDGELDYMDDECESEEEFMAAINQMSHCIGPAIKLVDELRSTEPESSEDLKELEEQIEDAEEVIAKAEWVVGNPQGALAQWNLQR